MKHQHPSKHIARAGAATLIYLFALQTTQAGDLNPPGGPIAATMKTLDEIEPRIAINASNTPGSVNRMFQITAPGSYYLLENVIGEVGKHGIFVTTSNVTIDLNGFAMIGGVGSLRGISFTTNKSNVTILNGHISGWDDSGIGGAVATRLRISNVTVTDCGWFGIQAGTNSIVENCIAKNNSRDGIGGGVSSRIINCISLGNGSNSTRPGITVGDHSVISGCTSSGNVGSGIVAGANCLIVDSSSSVNGDRGITTLDNCTIRSCTARENTTFGIWTSTNCSISASSSSTNVGSGISASTGSSISDCVSQSNGFRGISTAEGCAISRCSAYNNTGDGIWTNAGTMVSNNCALFNNGDGIEIGDGCLVLQNVCYFNNTGAGIHIAGSNGGTRVDGNTVSFNSRGIDVDFPDNLIIRNGASDNITADFDIVGGNTVGQIFNFSISGGTIASVVTGGSGNWPGPWANFRY